ncbi:MAG: putative zinc-binding protein [Candidatus Lokiarchaeota archaeon]|nr:putative zinc-binding protein [Candidatus Lokiarchaeota archaeon]
MRKKVGIIACSGEELLGGTLSRAAARIVVEKLRPQETIILCAPLFAAGGLERHGGQEERNFAKEHPTITIEGCEEECAKIAVDKYSGPPAATFNITEFIDAHPKLKSMSREDLGEDGMKLAEIIAEEIAKKVDELFIRK